MTPEQHIAEVKAGLVAASVVEAFELVEEWVLPDRGYLRVRMRLTNGDFVEASEYFVMSEGDCVTECYRHQWMNGARQQLRRRWDNVEHYPGLPAFPHHVHYPDGRVEPGQCLSILELLGQLAVDTV